MLLLAAWARLERKTAAVADMLGKNQRREEHMAQGCGKKRGSGQNVHLSAAELLALEVQSTLEAGSLTAVRVTQTLNGKLCTLFSIRPGCDEQWHQYMHTILPALGQLPFSVWIGPTPIEHEGQTVPLWTLRIDTEMLGNLRRAVQEVRTVFMRVVNGAVDGPAPDQYGWFTSQLSVRGDGLYENF